MFVWVVRQGFARGEKFQSQHKMRGKSFVISAKTSPEIRWLLADIVTVAQIADVEKDSRIADYCHSKILCFTLEEFSDSSEHRLFEVDLFV